MKANRLLKVALLALAAVVGLCVCWKLSRLTESTSLIRLRPNPMYLSANVALAKSANRVVYMGDSITQYWPLAKSFPSRNFVDRGISAQTTGDMLLRFRQDVVDLRPATVVIQGGVNDILNRDSRDTEEASIPAIESNLASMADIAEQNHIRPVFGSVLPVDKRLLDHVHPKTLLILNRWIEDFCAKRGYSYLNYYDSLTDRQGYFRTGLTNDGLHPNAAGYALMSAVIGRLPL